MPGDQRLFAGQVLIKAGIAGAFLPHGTGLRAAQAMPGPHDRGDRRMAAAHLRRKIRVGGAGGQRQLVRDEASQLFPADRMPRVTVPQLHLAGQARAEDGRRPPRRGP